ncbi:MAG: hypothetical protein WC496_01210 [Phycisphaerae bacterium]|jgi:hypothetical protein
MPREQLFTFNRYYETSDFSSALLFAEKNIKKRNNPSGEDLLWTLQAASAKRILKDYASSTKFFDKAEDFLKYYDLHSSVADDIGAVAVNDNVVPYKGREYDGVMVNVYKALNFMSEGNLDLARVEFNRALDRQRRTKEKFEKEISKAKEQIDKAQYSNLIESSLSNPNLEKSLHDKYPELYEYQAYKDYVNPFVTYLASVYFNATGRPAEARDLLKETAGLIPENSSIAAEFEETENLLASNGTYKNTVWVIFENGLGPIKDEFRIDLPLFIATNRVLYAGIALPKLEYRDDAFSYLQIQADGATYSTQVVGNMDRVINSEFKKDFDAALIREIISTTAKVVAQYALTNQNSKGSDISAILLAVYSFATNAADVRIWTSLPKNFQAVKFPMPQNKLLRITDSGSESFDIAMPDCNNVLVYIKIIQQNSKPVFYVIPL